MDEYDRQTLAVQAEMDRKREAVHEEYHRGVARIECDGLWLQLVAVVVFASGVAFIATAEPFGLASSVLAFVAGHSVYQWCRSLWRAVRAVREYRERYGHHPEVGLWRNRRVM